MNSLTTVWPFLSAHSLAAVSWPTLADGWLHWGWLLPTLLPPVLSGVLFSPHKNKTLLAVQRRQFVPGGYRKVFKAKTDGGDFEFQWYVSGLATKIRNGRIVLSELNKAQQLYLQDWVSTGLNLIRS